jgi:mRNA interferase HigB
MRILTYKTIREFTVKVADSKIALEDWFQISKKSKWDNLHKVKNTFNSVDYVGNERYVFNIKGNKFRLVVKMMFKPQIIFIRFIGTHAEYDKIDCRTI